MPVVSVIVGVAAVAAVTADLGLTVLHPSLRGPLSDRAERLAWAAVRGLTRLGGRDRLLSFGGPAAMAADLLTWLVGLWLGFALVYAPYLHALSRLGGRAGGHPRLRRGPLPERGEPDHGRLRRRDRRSRSCARPPPGREFGDAP